MLPTSRAPSYSPTWGLPSTSSPESQGTSPILRPPRNWTSSQWRILWRRAKYLSLRNSPVCIVMRWEVESVDSWQCYIVFIFSYHRLFSDLITRLTLMMYLTTTWQLVTFYNIKPIGQIFSQISNMTQLVQNISSAQQR